MKLVLLFKIRYDLLITLLRERESNPRPFRTVPNPIDSALEFGIVPLRALVTYLLASRALVYSGQPGDLKVRFSSTNVKGFRKAPYYTS